ncbi:MAG: glutamate synthase-related protein [Planctomycetota bacterium]|nr:glutamate synthase-related protein [Planctomycetota bacterium]
MASKYHIHTEPAPPRFRPIGKLGIVEWREDCSSCHNCVKRACVYGLFRDEADALHETHDFLDYIYQCKGCLSCVQNCTKGILTRVVNPEYKRLGDAYFTPDIVAVTWFQSETGKIPVSGGGYNGPFSGAGFDSMWTDMSEIVRPTRDGIHGREYISTSVNIGRKERHLAFKDGQPVPPPPLLEIPMPVIFDVIPSRWRRGPIVAAVAKAAAQTGLLTVVDADDIPASPGRSNANMLPQLARAAQGDAFAAAPVVMLPDGEDVFEAHRALKARSPNRIVVVRTRANPRAADRISRFAAEGVEAICLTFDPHGREDAPANPRHVRDVLREVHRRLIKDGTRDQVTLISSGGIALAEHVTKALLCGADLVAIDVPLLLAMECRLCKECGPGRPCPIALENIDLDYAARRVVNLVGAWHQQLIEMMGAMGMREARRLRGEVGRCMFYEDLERDTFGRLFGQRKADRPAL